MDSLPKLVRKSLQRHFSNFRRDVNKMTPKSYFISILYEHLLLKDDMIES